MNKFKTWASDNFGYFITPIKIIILAIIVWIAITADTPTSTPSPNDWDYDRYGSHDPDIEIGQMYGGR